MFTTIMHCSNIITELWIYSNVLFCSGHDHLEHDLPALRVSDLTEGCREVLELGTCKDEMSAIWAKVLNYG